jgi:LacI family transcriptional regulator
MLVPDISNPFCAEITLGAEDVARQAGYSVVLGNTGPQGRFQALQLESLLSRRVDGMLLVAGVFDQASVEQVGRKRLMRTPLVMIDRSPGVLKADLLQADQQAAAELAVSHLLSLGHRRIACVSGPMGQPISQQRVKGWRTALQRSGASADDEMLFEGDFSIASGYKQGLRCLRHAEVTAVFAANDMMALGVLHAAAELGRKVPEQLSVVGIDGIAMGQFSQPALTSVGTSLHGVGGSAARMLIERIEHPDRPWRCERRPFELITRGSSGPVPVEEETQA